MSQIGMAGGLDSEYLSEQQWWHCATRAVHVTEGTATQLTSVGCSTSWVIDLNSPGWINTKRIQKVLGWVSKPSHWNDNWDALSRAVIQHSKASYVHRVKDLGILQLCQWMIEEQRLRHTIPCTSWSAKMSNCSTIWKWVMYSWYWGNMSNISAERLLLQHAWMNHCEIKLTLIIWIINMT